MQDKKKLLHLGLSHCSFLKWNEKFLLAEELDSLKSLSLLSLKDISVLVKRSLKTKLWEKENIEKIVEADLKIMEMYGIHAVGFEEKDFPPLLREITDPPILIFYRGQLPVSEIPAIAMVGTRHPTGEGINSALTLGKDFAERSVTVISGLAYGIDTFSHRGCLEGGGKTVAVLACGVEVVYPRTNKRLATAILETGGCILSEYPPGTEPMRFRFPERNRIISGLSRAVIIVEAPKKSGALITAEFALEQGRDVFVCENILNSQQNSGSILLKEDGAAAIKTADDVLKEWNM